MSRRGIVSPGGFCCAAAGTPALISAPTSSRNMRDGRGRNGEGLVMALSSFEVCGFPRAHVAPSGVEEPFVVTDSYLAACFGRERRPERCIQIVGHEPRAR